MVERFGVLEAPDVEVHMAHRRVRRSAVPGNTAGCGDHALDVQPVGRHGELAIVMSPGCCGRSA